MSQQERVEEVTMDSRDWRGGSEAKAARASFIQPVGSWHGPATERNKCLGYSLSEQGCRRGPSCLGKRHGGARPHRKLGTRVIEVKLSFHKAR